MKFTAILVATVKEQLAAGETEPILPEGVKLLGRSEFAVFYDGNYNRIAGKASNVRVEDGRLVADIETIGHERLPPEKSKFGVSIVVRDVPARDLYGGDLLGINWSTA